MEGKCTGIGSMALLQCGGCGQTSQEMIIIEQVISLPHLHTLPRIGMKICVRTDKTCKILYQSKQAYPILNGERTGERARIQAQPSLKYNLILCSK